MVLAGALASSAAFGFPVFCLICPVGLTFALVIALWRLAEFNELSWSIAIFAGFLFLEVFVLRRWCRSFCPLGAVMTLLSWGNRTFRIRSTPNRHVFAKTGCCPAKSAAQSAQRDLIPLRLKQQTSHRHAAPNVESALTLALHKHCNSLFSPAHHPLSTPSQTVDLCCAPFAKCQPLLRRNSADKTLIPSTKHLARLPQSFRQAAAFPAALVQVHVLLEQFPREILSTRSTLMSASAAALVLTDVR